MTLSIFDRFITQTGSGETVPSAVLTVNDTGASTGLSTIWQDRDGTIPAGNPITADSDGRVQFYAEPGRYNMSASFNTVVVTYPDVLITPEDASGIPLTINGTTTDVETHLNSIDGAFDYIFNTVADSKTGTTLRGGVVTLKDGDRIRIIEREESDWKVTTGLTADEFSIIDLGNSLQAQLIHRGRPTGRQFGAFNTAATTANLQALVDFTGLNSYVGVLTEGGYVFDQDLVFHRNSKLVGVGSSFGASLIPVGQARIVFDGGSEPGGFVFHAGFDDISILGDLSTLASSEVINIDQCFSIEIKTRAENFPSDNTIIKIQNSNDVKLIRPTLFGSGTGSGVAVEVGDDSTVKIENPDFENINRGLKVTGNSGTKVDVTGIYAERHIVAYENTGAGATLNLTGGKIKNPGSSAIAALLNGPGNVNGVEVDNSNGGTGFTTTSGNNPNVNFFGVDQDVIAADHFKGSSFNTLKNGVYRYETVTSKMAHTDDTFIDLFSIGTSTADRSTIVELDLWATSNGYGRAYKRFRFLVCKESGANYSISQIDTLDLTNSGSGNFSITCDINNIYSSSVVTIQGKFTMTGSANVGNTSNLYAKIACESVDVSVNVKVL